MAGTAARAARRDRISRTGGSGMGITRYVLKHPVTTIMGLLCLIVFGISSVFSAKLEQMPEMETPMMIISASYSGAGPEDVDELVTQPIEDAVSTLEGVKSLSSTSSDGRSRVMLEYDYGTDMDEAYDELKKKVDSMRGLPDDVEPSIMEMNMNAGTSMMLSISHSKKENLYDYVDQTIVPEFERISSVASVDTMGGSSKYVRVELISEKMAQYNVTMNDITSAVSSSNLAYPSGSAVSGNLELSVTTSLETEQVDELRDIPIATPTGELISLCDVADIYEAKEDRGGVSRYNGQETISISIQKQQSSTDMEVSEAVHKTIETLLADDADLGIEVARDTSDTILDSLIEVAQTMVMAVGISMVIIFLFFGDYKASLIVGSSIPTSILLSLIAMTQMGFSLNVITMSALVLGVGMMVDNSIVVLESCFRATADSRDKGALAYSRAALEGTGIVLNSIIGSTVTTCVVFLPLASISGMTGQMFKPLGYTVVFCMLASLISAMTIVPLCYLFYKPTETGRALMNAPVERLQRFYRRTMDSLLNHRALVMLASVGILAGTVVMASGMETELMTSDDTGTVSVSIETRPGLLTEKVHDALNQAEAVVAASDQVESYMHLESVLGKPAGESGNFAAGYARRNGGSKSSTAEDFIGQDEIEEIFNRTYGSRERKKPGYAKTIAPSVRDDSKYRGETRPQEEYLLVDGYNIIFAWEDLKELAKVSIAGARGKLMDLLCNYQAFRSCVLIVVFDAYKVVGNPGHTEDYHNIHVVYTKEAETADQYIERFAYKMGKEARVTVATSDGLEQRIILGAGCIRMSAKDLKEEVEYTAKQIQQEREKLPSGKKNLPFELLQNYLAKP